MFLAIIGVRKCRPPTCKLESDLTMQATSADRKNLHAPAPAGTRQTIAANQKLCAEALWWQCHRRVVADYLLAAGEEVLHILDRGRIEPARLTDAARERTPAVLTYPA